MFKNLRILLIVLITGCASTSQLGTVWEGGRKFIETDTMPAHTFTGKEFKSLTVAVFDAKNVRTLRGEIVDYVELGDSFTDDLLKKMYTMGKIRVTVGEVVDEVSVSDQVERKTGDVNVKTSMISRTIRYKSAPFRKVDAVLSGRILGFSPEEPFDRSYIEVYFKLTDNYDGTVYWIARIRGYYRNVITTLCDTIVNGQYTEHAEDLKAVR